MATSTRSPLRWQMSSSRAKGNTSSAASGRLRHLQAVATWASAQVPPLGAFLGSQLASTSELLGAPPSPSPHFTCQRCESILQVGINCSVRVRSRKKKQQNLVSKENSKEAPPPVNYILYYCQYCAFENIKTCTSKAYVKTKLSEMAACHKLSELSKGIEEKMTKDLGEKMTKTSNKELMMATKVLSVESAGSFGKKTKRKGWLSLKKLAASSASLSSTCSVPVLMKSTMSNLTPPRINNLASLKLMPKFSQIDSMAVTPVSSIKEQCPTGVSSLKVNLKLEQCNTSAGDRGSDKASDLVHFHQDRETSTKKSSLFTTNGMCLNASPHQKQRGLSDDVLNSRHCVGRVNPINSIKGVLGGQTSHASSSPRHLGQSGVAMEVDKEQQRGSNPSDANAIMLDQLTVAHSDSKHDNLRFATLGNSSYAISQMRSASVPDVPKDVGALKMLQSFSTKERGVLTSDIDVALNSRIVKPAKLLSRPQANVNKRQDNRGNKVQSLSKKRKLDDRNRSQKVAKKQKPMVPAGYMDSRGGKVASNFVPRKELQSKRKPLFRRMGRHWFVKCRSRTIKWRLL